MRIITCDRDLKLRLAFVDVGSQCQVISTSRAFEVQAALDLTQRNHSDQEGAHLQHHILFTYRFHSPVTD
jgi:hypothetical protein